MGCPTFKVGGIQVGRGEGWPWGEEEEALLTGASFRAAPPSLSKALSEPATHTRQGAAPEYRGAGWGPFAAADQ